MMRLKRPIRWNPKTTSSPYRKVKSMMMNRMESSLIRVMVLCTVLLVVFQMTTITDPIDFYLKVAGEIDSPAFKYDEYADQKNINGQSQNVSLYFLVDPDSLVVVKQNDKEIGMIKNETQLNVSPGTVYLDATDIPYPVVVEIVLNEKRYRVELDGDIKSFDLQLRERSTS